MPALWQPNIVSNLHPAISTATTANDFAYDWGYWHHFKSGCYAQWFGIVSRLSVDFYRRLTHRHQNSSCCDHSRNCFCPSVFDRLTFPTDEGKTTTGYVEVTVRAGNVFHKTQIPVNSQTKIDEVRQLVSKAQALAMQAA